MGLNENKGRHKQNEKTTERIVENIYKWCNQQGLNLKNNTNSSYNKLTEQPT